MTLRIITNGGTADDRPSGIEFKFHVKTILNFQFSS